jgi:CheY-like chemotaxis protein
MAINPNLKILLAEDNKINQRITMLTFKHMGVQCDIASNGQEAVSMYQQKLYDLILMDMQMPVMDGIEATCQIRAFEKGIEPMHRAFIVALTANDISDKRETCLEAGMDNFLEKPLQDNLLLELFSRSY